MNKETILRLSAWLADKEDPSLLKESGIKNTDKYLLDEAFDIIQTVLGAVQNE